MSFVLSFLMVYAITPVIIRIALKKRLVAEVGERSSHTQAIPALGGIAIFMASLFASMVTIPVNEMQEVQYILGGLLIIFLTGAKDDIEPLSAKNKTMGLLLGIVLIVVLGDIRLKSMYGLFGFYNELPYWISVLITLFTFFVITNAFNLIDGINGLAGSLGVVIGISFGTWFLMSGMLAYATIAFAITGGLLAFLRYNVTPASVFMGDSGSLVLGAAGALFAISFIDSCYTGNIVTSHCFNNPVAIAVTFLIIPLFDTLRVFVTRMLRGGSPFQPDRRHIHHLLVDTGRSHIEATVILVIVNIVFISLVFWLDTFLGLHAILFIEVFLLLALTYVLHRKANASRAVMNKQIA